jgi:ribosomal protein S4
VGRTLKLPACLLLQEKVEEMEQLSEELYQQNQELKDKYADLHEQLQRKQVQTGEGDQNGMQSLAQRFSFWLVICHLSNTSGSQPS